MTLSAAQRISAVERCLEGKDTPAKDLERALAEDAHRSLAAFVQQCWHVLEPGTPLEWGWHLDLICAALERVTAGETRDLLICIPPGFMKSLIGSVFWPAWWWLRDPTQRLLTLSSSDPLAVRDSWKMRNVITSEWYRRLAKALAARAVVADWGMTPDQNQKVNFVNTAMGGRQCFSTGGSVTGHRGGGYLVDDPHQVADVLGAPEQVEAALGKAHEKVDVVLPSRVNDQRTAWSVTIQQRVHEDDVAGRKLKRHDADVAAGRTPRTRIVVLPMHAFEEDHPWRHPDDPRAPGELLDPVRMPEEVVAELAAKLETVPGQARAQLEQSPVPPTGGTFKRAWMNQRYPWDPQRPPKPYTEIVATVDATFKKTKSGAFNSVQVWGRQGWSEYYLLDEVHERLAYVDIRQVLRDVNTKWHPNAMLIELKANGEALLSDLKGEIPCIVGFVPDAYGDKVARAQLSTPMWQGNGVWLPTAEHAEWIADFCNEFAAFPGSLNKDRIDAMSQLFLWWQERRGPQKTGDALTKALAGLLKGLG